MLRQRAEIEIADATASRAGCSVVWTSGSHGAVRRAGRRRCALCDIDEVGARFRDIIAVERHMLGFQAAYKRRGTKLELGERLARGYQFHIASSREQAMREAASH
jgi:hypothetical protein